MLFVYYPELNIRWLLLGEGEMWLNAPVTKEKDSGLVDVLKHENSVLQAALIEAKDEIITLLKEKNERN